MDNNNLILDIIKYLNNYNDYVNTNKITKKFNLRMSSLLRILTSMEELNIIQKKLLNNIIYVKLIKE